MAAKKEASKKAEQSQRKDKKVRKRRRRTAEEIAALKYRLLTNITRHVGRSNAIGMGELYERVMQKQYNHRINDTASLRKLIVMVQDEGVAICSDKSGYWLASAGSELNSYCRGLQNAALSKLRKAALLKNIKLEDLIVQIQIDVSKTDKIEQKETVEA